MGLTENLESWTKATGNLPWGVQGLCHDALTLAAADKVTLVHGANYYDGRPCLFNAIRQMTQQLEQSPASFAGDVVRAFDEVNSDLKRANVNTDSNKVSPLAAEVLLHHFAPLKGAPTAEEIDRINLERESFMRNCTPYIEPTDEEVMTQWLLAIESEAPNDATTNGVRN
jgi:hypothetical protein